METNEMLFYFLLHLVLSSISLNMNICLNREYVVDLIGEPGNVHDPDSSINGSVRFSVPSPFQISHLKEFQQPYMDCDIKCQLENSNYTFAHPSGVCSGMLHYALLQSLSPKLYAYRHYDQAMMCADINWSSKSE